MLSAAVKGDLGPLAQAVAKYQLEHKLRKELEKLDMMEKKLKVVTSENNNKKVNSNNSFSFLIFLKKLKKKTKNIMIVSFVSFRLQAVNG